MPVEKTYPTCELLAACDYHAVSGRRVMLAWTMMAGVNTRDEDARLLAELIDGLPIMLDLIDVNDPSGRFRPPTRAELSTFRDALTDISASRLGGVTAAVRTSPPPAGCWRGACSRVLLSLRERKSVTRSVTSTLGSPDSSSIRAALAARGSRPGLLCLRHPHSKTIEADRVA